MTTSETKTCSGKQILSKRLSCSITPNNKPLLEQHGFAFYEPFVKLNIIKIEKDNMVINGVFYNRIISISCINTHVTKITEQQCKDNAEYIFNLIETLITKK